MCTTEPQSNFFPLRQLKNNSSMSTHPSGPISVYLVPTNIAVQTAYMHLSSATCIHTITGLYVANDGQYPSQLYSVTGNNTQMMLKTIINLIL